MVTFCPAVYVSGLGVESAKLSAGVNDDRRGESSLIPGRPAVASQR